jgi:hypothetical protein
MKQITLKDQPRLTFGQTLLITLNGIRYRIFRASVTAVVVAVAIAFLMNILSESILKQSISRKVEKELIDKHILNSWITRLTSPPTLSSLLHELSDSQSDLSNHREIQRMGDLTDNEMIFLQDQARKARSYLTFFETLNYGKRRNLVWTMNGTDIFDWWQTPTGMEKFKRSLGQMKSIKFVSSISELDGFTTRWPEIKSSLTKVIESRKKAIAEIHGQLKEQSLLQVFADNNEQFGTIIRSKGFLFDKTTIEPIVFRQAEELMKINQIEKNMKDQQIRLFVAGKLNIIPSEIDSGLLWKKLHDRTFSQDLLTKMKQCGLFTFGLSSEDLSNLAKSRTSHEKLLHVEQLTSDTGKGFWGIGQRMSWLLLISLVVCGIGICNAMFMSVTERFSEIATLKCLGALDSFVMVIFVLESVFLGFVGGVLGVFLGALIGLGRIILTFGFEFIYCIPVRELLVGMTSSLIVGVVLAAGASIFPSLKAARLAPMEVMRIE